MSGGYLDFGDIAANVADQINQSIPNGMSAVSGPKVKKTKTELSIEKSIKDIQDNTTLDDLTKKELIKGYEKGLKDYKTALGSSTASKSVSNVWSDTVATTKYLEGAGKKMAAKTADALAFKGNTYRYRHYQKEMTDLVKDRPGRIQTVLSRSQTNKPAGGL